VSSSSLAPRLGQRLGLETEAEAEDAPHWPPDARSALAGRQAQAECDGERAQRDGGELGGVLAASWTAGELGTSTKRQISSTGDNGRPSASGELAGRQLRAVFRFLSLACRR